MKLLRVTVIASSPLLALCLLNVTGATVPLLGRVCPHCLLIGRSVAQSCVREVYSYLNDLSALETYAVKGVISVSLVIVAVSIVAELELLKKFFSMVSSTLFFLFVCWAASVTLLDAVPLSCETGKLMSADLRAQVEEVVGSK